MKMVSVNFEKICNIDSICCNFIVCSVCGYVIIVIALCCAHACCIWSCKVSIDCQSPFLSLSIETPQYVDIHAGTSADLYIMYHNGDKPKDYFVVLNSWSDCTHLCYHFQNLCIKLDVANGHTVKPLNRGHFGDGPFVPCREVVLFSEVLF